MEVKEKILQVQSLLLSVLKKINPEIQFEAGKFILKEESISVNCSKILTGSNGHPQSTERIKISLYAFSGDSPRACHRRENKKGGIKEIDYKGLAKFVTTQLAYLIVQTNLRNQVRVAREAAQNIIKTLPDFANIMYEVSLGITPQIKISIIATPTNIQKLTKLLADWTFENRRMKGN